MKWPLATIGLLFSVAGAAQRPAPSDAVLQLQRRIDAHEASLKFEERTGYLRSVLDALNIPTSSQALVFSRTSLEIYLISPETPRALYFNDRTYVAFIQGGSELEVATLDPHYGVVFYVLAQTSQTPPRFRRDDVTVCIAT